ncbi:Monooxygenase FAD-binding protein [Lasiodiplodia theobromae]|nr:Monooxygenase FAD-binding protein [Lasiodiplodia theobromae]KAF4540142.1 Monooxygenase FAD-binding protein [Lasiodiplodia theobromae]KAF9632451.1 Monooxygenase FAD-binding protein [Lasiodiplodia theobromae]
MAMQNYADRLDIIIVGAGLGGLAASIECARSGHNVTVLEGASELAEVGAGLQITPNSSKLLKRWGVYEKLQSQACEPKSLVVHRYTGKILAKEDNFDEHMNERYGSPFSDVHRVDLQQALVATARELGVTIRLGQRVDALDLDAVRARIRTTSGDEYHCDLVVGADGLWSKCRECLLGRKAQPLPTGDLAYRIVLRLDQIEDPELRDMIANPQLHFWIGPDAHVVAYSLRGDKWKLMHREEMDSWISERGNLVMIGDACHPMLPYLAQGANSALEDGAVLGRVLAGVRGGSSLPRALRLFQRLRKARGEAIVRETFKQRASFHMPDGPEQVARDELFLSKLGKEIDCAFPSRWTCPEVQPWLYGYDAWREVDNALWNASGVENATRL